MKRLLIALMLCALPAPLLSSPLCCGKLSVMIKAGVTPTTFSDRQPSLLTAPPAVLDSNLIVDFNDQFEVPWNVGAEIAWNASCNIQFFLEYAHTQAKGKVRNTAAPTSQASPIRDEWSTYRVNSGYLGARYYFCKICCLNPYVGFKAGFAAQERVRDRFFVDGVLVPLLSNGDYYRSFVATSGGLQLGLEWFFCRCLSFVVQGEFVGTCGLRPNRNIAFEQPVDGITNVSIGRTGWVLSWPITIGLRYTF